MKERARLIFLNDYHAKKNKKEGLMWLWLGVTMLAASLAVLTYVLAFTKF